MADETRNLGLFPLGLVLLPGEQVPLHIFEPRYRALVADCTLGASPFVISVATDEGVARTGCTAFIDGLIRRFADGRLNIVVTGGERVEIVEQTHGELYVTARVTTVPDNEPDADEALVAEVLERFARFSEAVAGAAHDPLKDDVPVSYAVAGTIELDLGLKQRLLESRSENERLGIVREALDAALAGLDRRQVAEERAATNGKVTLQ